MGVGLGGCGVGGVGVVGVVVVVGVVGGGVGGGGGGGELKRTWKTCVCCARAAANFFLVIGVGATAATAPELAFLPARMSFNLRSVSCASVQSCLRSYRAAVLSTILLVPYITGRVQLQSLRDTTPSHNGHSSNK